MHCRQWNEPRRRRVHCGGMPPWARNASGGGPQSRSSGTAGCTSPQIHNSGTFGAEVQITATAVMMKILSTATAPQRTRRARRGECSRPDHMIMENSTPPNNPPACAAQSMYGTWVGRILRVSEDVATKS